MRLYEFEGKEIFKRYGIEVPLGIVIESPDEVPKAIEVVGLPAVVKAQVLVGSRGRAGGVVIVRSVDEALAAAKRLFSEGVRGVKPRKLLIEKAVDILRELYVSVTVDRSTRRYVILASAEGGVEIEELAASKPEAIVKVYVDPLEGLLPYHLRYVELGLVERGLDAEVAKRVSVVVEKLYRIMMDYDAELVEINPLALTRDGKLVALDSKIIVDDNALFRQTELFKDLLRDTRDFTEAEVRAKQYGFSYVELDGEIAVVANGAGLTMATMDMVAYFGGKPACFLDVGGGATRERVKEAIKLVLASPRVKGVFINIYGGITRCDEVAKGIVEAVKEMGVSKPMVVRMVGTNEEEGKRILKENGIEPFDNDEEAAKRIVELVYGVRR